LIYRVAELDGKVLGVAILSICRDNKSGEIERVATKRNCQGNGVAKNICKELEKEATKNDIEYLYGFARASSKSMQKIFLDLGFKPRGLLSGCFLVHDLENGGTKRESFVYMDKLLCSYDKINML